MREIVLCLSDAEFIMLESIVRKYLSIGRTCDSFWHNDDSKFWRSMVPTLGELACRIIVSDAPLSDEDGICPSTVPLPF